MTVGEVLLSAAWLSLVILGLFVISGFAGLLPVVSWVLGFYGKFCGKKMKQISYVL